MRDAIYCACVMYAESPRGSPYIWRCAIHGKCAFPPIHDVYFRVKFSSKLSWDEFWDIADMVLRNKINQGNAVGIGYDQVSFLPLDLERTILAMTHRDLFFQQALDMMDLVRMMGRANLITMVLFKAPHLNLLLKLKTTICILLKLSATDNALDTDKWIKVASSDKAKNYINHLKVETSWLEIRVSRIFWKFNVRVCSEQESLSKARGEEL